MPTIVAPLQVRRTLWADDAEDKENIPGTADPDVWQVPRNPVPIPVHRQHAVRESPLAVTNRFTPLQPPKEADSLADASPALPVGDHPVEASVPPSLALLEAVPKKKPVSRKSKAKPPSQP